MRVNISAWLRRLLITATAFAAVGLMAVAVMNISFLNPVGRALKNFSITDLYFQMLGETGRRPTSRSVTIVDMTELRRRSDIAAVIDSIEALHPAVLGIDVVFEGVMDDTVADNRLMDQAERYRNVVYGNRLYQDGEGREMLIRSFFAPFIRVNEGCVNFPRDLYGGIKRQLPLGIQTEVGLLPSFALSVANAYAGCEVAAAEAGSRTVNFSPMHYERLRHDSIAAFPERIENRIVLLGAVGEEADMHYTPLGKMPGVELQAYSIDTLIGNRAVRRCHWSLIAIVSAVLALLTCFVQERFRRWADGLRWHSLRFLLTTEMAVSMLTFALMAVFLALSFFVFRWSGVFVNLGWAFSAMAFLDVSRQFFDTASHLYHHNSSNS